jgi:lysyl-tRNA synthetase class II
MIESYQAYGDWRSIADLTRSLVQNAAMADEASGPTELLIVEDGNHIANNRPYRYRHRTADWMAEQLGLPRI